MAMFNPIMLSMAIESRSHNIVGTAGLGQTGRNIQSPPAARYRHSPFGSQLTSSRLVTYADDKDVAYAIACVFGSAAMLADPIATDAEAWIGRRDDISLDRIWPR